MTDQRMLLFQHLRSSIFSQPGETTPTVRATIAQRVAQLSRLAHSEGIHIPPELEGYIKKVALSAYRVTDEDIEALKAIGYSEDAIFEITLSIALSAGMNGLIQGLTALQGAKYAFEDH